MDGLIETLITIEADDECVRVRIRGPRDDGMVFEARRDESRDIIDRMRVDPLPFLAEQVRDDVRRATWCRAVSVAVHVRGDQSWMRPGDRLYMGDAIAVAAFFCQEQEQRRIGC